MAALVVALAAASSWGGLTGALLAGRSLGALELSELLVELPWRALGLALVAVAAAVTALGAHALGRRVGWLGVVAVVLLCLPPFVLPYGWGGERPVTVLACTSLPCLPPHRGVLAPPRLDARTGVELVLDYAQDEAEVRLRVTQPDRHGWVYPRCPVFDAWVLRLDGEPLTLRSPSGSKAGERSCHGLWGGWEGVWTGPLPAGVDDERLTLSVDGGGSVTLEVLGEDALWVSPSARCPQGIVRAELYGDAVWVDDSNDLTLTPMGPDGRACTGRFRASWKGIRLGERCRSGRYRASGLRLTRLAGQPGRTSVTLSVILDDFDIEVDASCLRD